MSVNTLTLFPVANLGEESTRPKDISPYLQKTPKLVTLTLIPFPPYSIRNSYPLIHSLPTIFTQHPPTAPAYDGVWTHHWFQTLLIGASG